MSDVEKSEEFDVAPVQDFEVPKTDDAGNIIYQKDESGKSILDDEGNEIPETKKVWDTDFEGESRTVDMHIKTLRQKLLDEGGCIKTVRNVGYVMELKDEKKI